jgi:hypothetical protein
MPDDDKLHPMKPEAARAQAADYLGFTAGIVFDLGNDESWMLPNPAFLDTEQRKRHRAHQRFMKSLDKETVEDPIIEGREVERYVYPYQKDGEDVDDDVLLCKALMGDDIYDKFIAADGRPGQVAIHWAVMNRQMEVRTRVDSKSA